MNLSLSRSWCVIAPTDPQWPRGLRRSLRSLVHLNRTHPNPIRLILSHLSPSHPNLNLPNLTRLNLSRLNLTHPNPILLNLSHLSPSHPNLSHRNLIHLS